MRGEREGGWQENEGCVRYPARNCRVIRRKKHARRRWNGPRQSQKKNETRNGLQNGTRIVARRVKYEEVGASRLRSCRSQSSFAFLLSLADPGCSQTTTRVFLVPIWPKVVRIPRRNSASSQIHRSPKIVCSHPLSGHSDQAEGGTARTRPRHYPALAGASFELETLSTFLRRSFAEAVFTPTRGHAASVLSQASLTPRRRARRPPPRLACQFWRHTVVAVLFLDSTRGEDKGRGQVAEKVALGAIFADCKDPGDTKDVLKYNDRNSSPLLLLGFVSTSIGTASAEPTRQVPPAIGRVCGNLLLLRLSDLDGSLKFFWAEDADNDEGDDVPEEEDEGDTDVFTCCVLESFNLGRPTRHLAAVTSSHSCRSLLLRPLIQRAFRLVIVVPGSVLR
ncbi:hypothetical protein Naga_100039g18 [Nannochloropsis gaditana]|uniref:Uncharacterized protein n=1 Tax=Nannochloropsis gaditana TaxID=72520 RepID=W7T6C6_9STRA|nr:hypothetical protein Naga_100039g18 [Nannochloropsis gaditana]